jgi:MoaA/NifB/PqqE/SkfB family radical SAM enzyme
VTSARTRRVVTNLRCNQACTYCDRRSPTDDLAAIAPGRVRRQIDDARQAGAGELVFTGGEPTLRRDLSGLVEYARRLGFESIGVETNATLLDEAEAARLASAGLERAYVNLTAWGPALDAITRDPGGFQATVRGVRALLLAGIRVEIAVSMVRSALPGLEELPTRVAEAFPEVRSIILAVPFAGPDPGEILTLEEARDGVSRIAASGRRCGIGVRLGPAARLPPCLFPTAEQHPGLFALSPGAGSEPTHCIRVEACVGCGVRDRCSGFPEAAVREGRLPPLYPVRSERRRRSLSLISSIEDQIARELTQPSLSRGEDGSMQAEAIVRTNFRCNQACGFCFVSTHLPDPSPDAVTHAIAAAASRGDRIVLSGGEPTLHPNLLDFVRTAHRLSHLPVVLQTNAVRLDDRTFVDALVEAGLGEAFVSLHGSRSEIAEAVTEAPGTFERTLRGIDNLWASPVRVTLNFVICQRNWRDLPAVVRLVAGRWPRTSLCISFVAPSTDLVPNDPSWVPRYSDVLPTVAAATAEAARLGVRIDSFDGMCGLPLCLVPGPLQRHATIAELPAEGGDGEFVKAAACERCALTSRCFGLRRRYAALYGTSELVTVPSA